MSAIWWRQDAGPFLIWGAALLAPVSAFIPWVVIRSDLRLHPHDLYIAPWLLYVTDRETGKSYAAGWETFIDEFRAARHLPSMLDDALCILLFMPLVGMLAHRIMGTYLWIPVTYIIITLTAILWILSIGLAIGWAHVRPQSGAMLFLISLVTALWCWAYRLSPAQSVVHQARRLISRPFTNHHV